MSRGPEFYDSKDKDKIVIIGCTDIHLSNRDPGPWVYQKSYREFMFDCVDQIYKFAIQQEADALVIAGDVFDSRRADRNPPEFLNECIRLFKQFKNQDIPVLGIAGNHDLGPDGLLSFKDQPLGTLELAEVFYLLDHGTVQISSPTGGLSLFISGFSYGTDYDRFIHTPAEKDITSDLSFHIRLGHFLFGPESGDYFGESVLGPDRLGDGDYDAVFLGHRHKDQGIKEIGGKFYVNPGSVTRNGRHSDDRFRRPSCFRLVVDRSSLSAEFKIARLKVPSAETILDFQELDTKKRESKDLDQYIASLTQHAVHPTGDARSILTGNNSMPIEIKLKCLEYLDRAEEEVKKL